MSNAQGHWNIRRVETVMGTPIRVEGKWFGGFGSKEEAVKTAKSMVEREAIGSVAIKYEITYMK
jgi:hypothetical protein